MSFTGLEILTRGVTPDRFLFPAQCGGPTFSSVEVAKVFFGRSISWMRWRERRDHFVLEGKPVIPERHNGIRRYSLFDIERLAHALYEHNALTARQTGQALAVVSMVAEIYGLL